MNNYILEGHTPKKVDDIIEWARSVGSRENWRVNETKIGEVRISTVFLGLDHQYGDGPPILFETMIFGGDHDEFCNRYSTWEEAEHGHQDAVEMVRLGTKA